MRFRRWQLAQVILLTILVLLVTVSFMHAPGQGDIASWERWANDVDTLGPVQGFEAIKADYPPFSSLILFAAIRAAHIFGIGTFGAVKLAILVLLCLTSLVFWIWTKNFRLALIVHLSLLLNSVVLGYIDVFFAPSLLLALWAFKEEKLTWFAIFYAITCLTKWQPILIAPFLALALLNIKHIKQWRQIKFKKLIVSVLLPASTIFSLTLVVFGVPPVLGALKAAFSHNFLSGNALNFDWILTHFLHVLDPGQFGGLVAGQAYYIRTTSLAVTLAPRLLFFLFYAVTLVVFIRRDKGFEELINFSLIGYFAYYSFNPGVHENHLFLIAVLSIVLFWLNREHFMVMLILIVMSNINLVLFYGLDGTGLGFSRVIANVDIALLLSLFNVNFFLMLWAVNILPRKTPQAIQSTSTLDLAVRE
jgi:hypothetical protein